MSEMNVEEILAATGGRVKSFQVKNTQFYFVLGVDRDKMNEAGNELNMCSRHNVGRVWSGTKNNSRIYFLLNSET